MATEIQTIKASQLAELTNVTDSNYIVVTDGSVSKKVKATLLKGSSGTGLTTEQINKLNTAYTHSQSTHVQPSDIPTRTSQLTNNSGFATEAYVTNAINNAQLGGGNSDIDLSIYQTIQDNTLTTTAKTIPTAINELKSSLNGIKVPTKTSELTNNSGFITAIPSEYITESELNAKGYLTSHQDISSLQTKTDNGLSTTNKTVIGAINELKGIIDSLQNRITALENQQDTTVSVTGVSLNNNTLTLNAGDTSTLIATVLPTNATNKSVTWSTNNSSVASVNSGTVTAHAKGQATIRVTTADGGYSASCSVTVNEVSTTVSVQGVTLSTNTLSMKVGGTTTLTANIRPSNATNKNVTWTSNSAVASVSNGLVTANSVGQATIRVTTEDGNYSDTCIVTVSETTTTTSVTGVTLNNDTLTMNKIGGTQTLGYTITPSNATNQNVTWSTSVPTVASVNNGIVTANANGTTVITIRTTDGGYTDTCSVTVNDQSQTGGGGDTT